MQSTTSPEAVAAESETAMISEGEPLIRLGGDEPVPARIGRYSIIERIGQGGMGSVYRGYDAKLRREVALKQVRADRLGPEAEARLVQEAQAMARLSHANVVAIYDVEIGQSLTMAMEYVAGQSVAQWLEQARPWREVIDVFVRAGRGLAAAHAVGLVHRDFKPANVLLGDDGTTKVTDFGLAKAEDALATRTGAEPSSVEHEGDSLVPMTRADTVMGTPKYMAPEQHTGAQSDARCDQYAFCVSLWESLLGTPPFSSPSYEALVKSKLAGAPAWPKASPVPGRIGRVILKGLSPKPNDRHPSMTVLLDALESAVARRHHLWTVGIATVAIAGAVAVTGLWQEQGMQPCTGAEAALSGIWDDAVRARVRDALVAHEVAYAQDTWMRVDAGLEAFATAWKDQHRATCEATTILGEQSTAVMDLRMSCLSRAKADLHARVGLLAEADVGVLRRAIELVDALPELDACEDVERLGAEPRAPEDPAMAARVEQARADLTRIRALGTAGKEKEALAAAQVARERFEGVEHPALQAELDYELGHRLQRMGKFEDAEDTLRKAFAGALERDVGWVLVPAGRELARVIGLDRAKPELGLALGEVAQSLARRHDPGGKAEADVLDVQGSISFAKADYAAAAAKHREALALGEAALGPDHHALSSLLVNLGMAVEVLGDYDEAAAHQERAIGLAEGHFGKHHPRIAKYVLNLGNVRLAQGRYDDAEAAYQRALVILEATYGRDHVAVATTIHNLGILDLQRGNYVRAEERVREAMAVRVAVHGPEHPDVADSWMMIGVIAQQDERAAEALDPIRAALTIREQLHGPDNLHVGKLRMNLGLVLGDLERYDEAEAEMQRALAIKVASMGPEHVEAGSAWLNLATLSSSRGDLPEAIARWEKALTILRSTLGAEHPDVAQAEAGLGQARLEAGEPARAGELLEHALSVFALDDTRPCRRASIEFALAKALWIEPGSRPRARELATQAADRCTEGSQAEDVAEIRRWIAEHSSPH